MKKTIIFILSLALGSTAFAQSLGDVTAIFNNGANALNNNEKTAALDFFKNALSGATAIGDEGAEIAGKCKDLIPGIYQSIATDLFTNSDIDGAIENLKASISTAKEYGNTEIETVSTQRLGQFIAKKGTDLLQAKDFAGAKAALVEAVQIDTTNGNALLRLGQTCMGLGDMAGAEEALKKAANNGQKSNANNLLASIKLKAASAALKAKDYKTALEAALESTQFSEKGTAYKIAGNCAAQMKDYKGAVTYFSKYLELSPKAADAAQVKANIEAFKKL